MGNYCSCAIELDQKELSLDNTPPIKKPEAPVEEEEKDSKEFDRNQSFPVSAKTGCEDEDLQFDSRLSPPKPATLSSTPYNVLARPAKASYFKIKGSQLKDSEFTENSAFKSIVNSTGIYIGDLKGQDIREGKGIQYWKGGGMYEGEWHEGQLQGQGRMIFPNGDIYRGSWLNSQMHGNGKYVRFSIGAYFDGNWSYGLQDGYGEEFWPDGSEYKGNYKGGKKDGKGVFKCTASTYTGDFSNDLMEGQGTMEWADKRTYCGQWLANQMHGTGEFQWPDGRRYNGEYIDNLKHGYGEFHWKDGRVFRGNWLSGHQHGIGAFTFANANGQEVTRTGEWFNGKRMRWISLH